MFVQHSYIEVVRVKSLSTLSLLCIQTGSEHNVPLDDSGGLIHLLVEHRVPDDPGGVLHVPQSFVQPGTKNYFYIQFFGYLMQAFSQSVS